MMDSLENALLQQGTMEEPAKKIYSSKQKYSKE